jgi:hypothetical protein
VLNITQKPWVKVVVWLVVLTFAPEQIAWAVDYNWRGMSSAGMTGSSPQASVAPGALLPSQDKAANEAIANTLKAALVQMVGQNATDIRLSRSVTVHRTSPLALSENKVNEIDGWLREGDRSLITCGAQALAGYFRVIGQGVTPAQISHYALLIDLLSDSIDIYTYNKAKRLENSLYALSQAALLFGAELKPVHFVNFTADSKEISKVFAKMVPFILFVDDDHMVLVKGLSKEGLLTEDNGVEKTMKFTEVAQRFSGYGLIRANADVRGLKVEYLDEEVAKAIQGAKKVYDKYDFSAVFEEDDNDSLWTSIAILAGSAVLGGLGGLGGVASGAGWSSGLAVSAFTTGMMTSQIVQAVSTMAVKDWGMSGTQAQILGSAVGGGVSSMSTGAFGGGRSWELSPTTSNPIGWVANHVPLAGDFLPGAVQGAATGMAQVYVSKYLVKDDSAWAQILVPVLGSAGGYLASRGVLNLMGYTTNVSLGGKTPTSVEGWDGTWKNLGSQFSGAMWNSLGDRGFQGMVVGQSIGNYVEYALNRYVFADEGEDSGSVVWADGFQLRRWQ